MLAAASSVFWRTISAALWMALPETTAARLAKVATPQSNALVSPSTTITSSTLDAELVGDDLREDRVVALPLRGEAGVDVDLAGDRMDLDVAALIGAEAGALDVAGEAEAEIPCRCGAPPPARRRRLSAPSRSRHQLQRLVILAAVEADLQAVREQQALARRRGTPSSAMRLRRRTSKRSSPSSSASWSIARSMAKQDCGRPQPR